MVTAAVALDGQVVDSAGDMATQLEPLPGAWAGKAFTIGFAAAGVPSAITGARSQRAFGDSSCRLRFWL
ncbi:divalent metal cation transporter [bacterium AH-315-O15]|nr:divalent metal cation transporter [bacterium AH-315-O15]